MAESNRDPLGRVTRENRSISDKDYKFLTEHSDVNKICEIGTGSGYSTQALSCNGAEVHTVDQYDHDPEFNEPVTRYIMHSKQFWESTEVSNFDLYFIDASLGWGDVEYIFERAADNFKIIYHDFMYNDKGVQNHKLVLKYMSVMCHTHFTPRGGTHCAMLECEKL